MPTINIKYVNPANPGKKYGSIKDANGVSYFVAKDEVSRFQPGTTVSIETETQDWSGKSVTVVKSGPATAGPGPTITREGVSTPTNTYSPPPRAANDSRQIFVTGVVGRAMGSGKFEPSHIEALTVAAMAAYDARLAA